MNFHLLWLALPVVSTLAGGLMALRLRRFGPLLVAIGAGLLLGAAFLDLLPEALDLGLATRHSAAEILGWALLSFLLFSAVELGIEFALEWWNGSLRGRSAGSQVPGRVAGAMLIFHSFRDGMAIGAAFAASAPVGYAIATGIAAHDFGDGMNTVILTTQGAQPTRVDYVFLALDAFAPFAGGLVTVWWLLSSSHTAVLLAVAAGFFLQMATSDFLPQIKQQSQPRRWVMLAAVVCGAAVIYAARLLAG